MKKLDTRSRTQIVALLVEGNSINSVCRITGAAKNTVLKLLADVGAACAAYQDRVMRGLTCKRLQLDEQWGFVGMKQKNVPQHLRGTLGYGDTYLWSAIDADTKLIPCWHIGTRAAESAYAFVHDLAKRLESRVQITSDGHFAYLAAIEDAFGSNVDFAQLIKTYGVLGEAKEDARRYSPPECTGAHKRHIIGNPNIKDVSTSFIERANLTMRMHNRRFTRLTNAFSKKLENHMHSISLHMMYYNFCRQHQTTKVSPAMAAGIDDHLWEIEELIMMTATNTKNVTKKQPN